MHNSNFNIQFLVIEEKYQLCFAPFIELKNFNEAHYFGQGNNTNSKGIPAGED